MEDVIQRALELIEAELKEPLTLASLAQRFGQQIDIFIPLRQREEEHEKARLRGEL